MLASAAHHYHQHQCRRRNLFSHCFALDAIRKLCSAAFIAPFKGRRLANRLMHIFFLLLCGIANCQWVNATAAAAAAATHQTAIFVQLELLGGQKEKLLQLVCSLLSLRKVPSWGNAPLLFPVLLVFVYLPRGEGGNRCAILTQKQQHTGTLFRSLSVFDWVAQLPLTSHSDWIEKIRKNRKTAHCNRNCQEELSNRFWKKLDCQTHSIGTQIFTGDLFLLHRITHT